MLAWDLLLTDARVATMRNAAPDYGVVDGTGTIAVKDGKIAWIGAASELPAGKGLEQRSLDGRWITPALIDCHTQLVFAGDRAEELERRLLGASYEDIDKSGGGIMSTVRDTRT